MKFQGSVYDDGMDAILDRDSTMREQCLSDRWTLTRAELDRAILLEMLREMLGKEG